VARVMWVDEAPDGDVSPIKVPLSLGAALAITAVVTVVVGILPQIVTRVTGAETFLTLGG
jgi:NADH-quinone oxidoreductase subunit N